jgi:3-oxoacyl-[acyl-carrier protein] reductase
LRKRLLNLGSKFSTIQCNFNKKKELNCFLNKLKRVRIDAVINNAGSYIMQKHFDELKLEDLEKVFGVNAFAPILIISAIYQNMARRKFGRIVNISSIAAKYGGSKVSLPYGSAKMALEGLTRTIAKEGARVNVLANTIRPGVVNTEFHQKFKKNMTARIKLIPMKRMGTPEEVAELAYFLGSDKNTFITNETIAVSGGE